MSDRTLKAYTAHDGGEGWAIVFAKSGVEARRLAANEMDCDFSEVDYCRRAPSLDRFKVTGNVSIPALLDIGWWIECFGCCQRIDAESVEEHGRTPVGTWSAPFCCSACRRRHRRRFARAKKLEIAAVADLSAKIAARFPDAAITSTYAYAPMGGRAAQEAAVHFTFPGSKCGGATARWRKSDPTEIDWTVARGDLDAFEAWRDRAKEGASA